MNNKFAIALCLHHKPWLIMSTLITLALQDYKDYDIYFLYQKGDGSCLQKDSYRVYFSLAAKFGTNIQLSPFDERVKEITRKALFKNVSTMEFENDHSLDSGAWYKFIKTGAWRRFSHMFFIQEGALFTRTNAISSAIDFMKSNNIHFLSSGHEKRKLPKDIFMRYNSIEKNSTEIDFYHDQKIKEVFSIFCRDKQFEQLYGSWDSKFKVTTQNHVPYIPDSFFKEFIKTAGFIKHQKRIAGFRRTVYENSIRRYLDDVIDDYIVHDKVIFHKDNALEWFGCSCQHLLSRFFLERFTQKIKEHDLYDALDVPFSGTPLEVIWGFLPNWLGFDKWFFDGIHRIRKNFVTYEREDSPEGMCNYINKYFRGKIQVVPAGDLIKIDRLHNNFMHLRDILSKEFFC